MLLFSNSFQYFNQAPYFLLIQASKKWMYGKCCFYFQDWIDVVIAVSPPKEYEDEV